MRFLFPICFLFLCHFLPAQDSTYTILSLDKALTENANAVVRLDDMVVELFSKREMSIKLTRVVTVLNKLGNKHTHTSIGYNNSIKVKHVQAVIYDAFGNEMDKIKRKDFRDVSAVSGGTLYSDSRVLYMEYTPVQYPYTVEFTYEVSTQNTGNIPSWYFLDGFLVSTEESKYTIVYNAPGLKPIIKEKNISGIDVSKTDVGNKISYKASHIEAIRKENLSPSFGKIAPKLLVRAINFNHEGYDASVQNWKDVGLWMHDNLLKDRGVLPEATKEKARSLVKGVTDNLEKAKLIYEYVQKNTRYISVQVGIGGLQPISAIDVDRVKYGDCKGLSNYTKALLNAVDVPAYYTHVESGRDKVDFEDDFADLGQGDHVILAIPYNDTYYWIDCTSQIHPFGFIGDFTDGRKVLVITPQGGELATTASYLNEENRQKTSASCSLNSDGGIKAEVLINTEGIQYDNRFYLEDKTNDDVIKHYKNYWSNINNLSVKEHTFKNDREHIVFTETVSLSATNYATKSGDRILFTLNVFNNNGYVPNRYRNRKMPLEIQRGFLDEDELTLQLPEGYQVEALPEEKNIKNEFGAYSMSASLSEDGKAVVYKRSLFVKEGAYPKEKYDSYRDFRRTTARADNAQMVLVKSNP